MKKLLLSASALLFALSLTACGGDDKAAEESAATDDKASTVVSEPATPATKTEDVKTEEAKPTTTPNAPPEAAAPSTPPAAAPSAPPTPTTPPEAAAPSTPPAAAPSAAPAATTAAVDGEKVYKGLCQTCHNAGIAGAPKLDDKAAWAPRLATGVEALYATSISGKGAMPPKGGNPALTDAEVKAAVDYMVKQIQ
ncbi:MAG: c-type cytochrome [bacterium]